jgi:hypothetical protein
MTQVKEKKYTMAEAAHILGVSVKTVSRYKLTLLRREEHYIYDDSVRAGKIYILLSGIDAISAYRKEAAEKKKKQVSTLANFRDYKKNPPPIRKPRPK